MYGSELIKTYFLNHPNPEFDLEFRKFGGFFCGVRDSVFHYERLYDRNILIKYEEVSEVTKDLWTDGKGAIGHVHLKPPYHTFYKSGAFMCMDVKKIIEIEPTKGWRYKEVKIKRKFWNKNLHVYIDNDNLSLYIECLSLMPYTLTNKRSNFTDLKRTIL